MDPYNEAEQIINGLHEHLGLEDFSRSQARFVTGKEAIQWMNKKGYPSGNQTEWTGFYLKHLVQEICKNEQSKGFESINFKTLYLVKGKYLWDTRFYDGNKEPFVTLNDVKLQNERLDKFKGFGLLLADSTALQDEDGSFAAWREEQRDGPSDYVRKRRSEGINPKMLKTSFSVNAFYSYYFSKEQFLQGIDDGWVTNDTFQANWRNSDDTLRNSKYNIILGGIPKECRLFVRNFNTDPDEFKFVYGDPYKGNF